MAPVLNSDRCFSKWHRELPSIPPLDETITLTPISQPHLYAVRCDSLAPSWSAQSILAGYSGSRSSRQLLHCPHKLEGQGVSLVLSNQYMELTGDEGGSQCSVQKGCSWRSATEDGAVPRSFALSSFFKIESRIPAHGILLPMFRVSLPTSF